MAEQLTTNAIRKVTAKYQKAVETGHQARMIDIHDVIDILLEIAEETERAAKYQQAFKTD